MGKNLSSCIPFDFYPHLTTNALPFLSLQRLPAPHLTTNTDLQTITFGAYILLNFQTTPIHENNCYHSRTVGVAHMR